MTERWTFGVEPLPQQRELAALLRRVASLALALEQEDPALDRLITELDASAAALAAVAPADNAPRLGADAPPEQRVYIDHARDIGAFNPAFPEYRITVDGNRATGTVTFPLLFEGPPGIVHGGMLATFFDSVMQQHNCDAGVAGKTTSLLVEYKRPTPVGVALTFTIEREPKERRITSRGQLVADDAVLCIATMEAIAGDVTNLPPVSPRRES
ncbi:MAG TPA: PaaI family thioesterase [Acidimicrobiia bacterium]|nr:PaaI family thioesterase [Acidimicrobiia bacterium]